jgi:Zn-dependent protease
MIRIPGKIPITIRPSFWFFAAFLGFFAGGGSPLWMLIWVGIILVSLLFHEFGHALTSLAFGQRPRIELVALGGLTYPEGPKLSFFKEFTVVLAGPFFGFLLFVIAYCLQYVPFFAEGMVGQIRRTFEIINIFWTVVNLIPVLPLDGGQLLRIVLEAIFGVRGILYSLITGTIIATAVSLFFFLIQEFLAGAFFFLFAFQSFDLWRKSRKLAEPDRNETVKKNFELAENLLRTGRKKEAGQLFEQVIEESHHQGLLSTASTQYLAALKAEKGESKEAYELLLPLKEELPPDLLNLLHRLAYEQKNYPLVVEIAGTCFQEFPSSEVALRTAEACAVLKQANSAIGWLEAALEEGAKNLGSLLNSPSFDVIRQDPRFQDFVKRVC